MILLCLPGDPADEHHDLRGKPAAACLDILAELDVVRRAIRYEREHHSHNDQPFLVDPELR